MERMRLLGSEGHVKVNTDHLVDGADDDLG
jgi:hypothetical protein